MSTEQQHSADVDFLAEVLTDLAIPEHVVIELRPDELVIDLTDRSIDNSPPVVVLRSRGWRLFDSSPLGSLVTPEIIKQARKDLEAGRDGVEVVGDGSRVGAGVRHPSPVALAAEYARRCFHRVEAGRHGPSLALAVKTRIEYFLRLDDQDFAACFDYQGRITPEYLQGVVRADRAAEQLQAQTVPSNRVRRRRKARRLGRAATGEAD